MADAEFPRRGLGCHHPLSLGQKLGSAIPVFPYYTKLAILASNSNASDNILKSEKEFTFAQNPNAYILKNSFLSQKPNVYFY